jgi:type VII secretion protein EccB
MQTRSDQAQAYRFVTRRIVAALLSGEPESAERPMRRFGMAIFGSAMVAAIVFAVVGIIGFLFPSGARLPADGAIVVVRETGATFVYKDGLLHPALNFTSARLAMRSDNPPIQRVSAKSLQGLPRGRVIGIPNLPDSLPDPKALTTGPWSACSQPESPVSSKLVTHLVIGAVRPGGRPLTNEALLIRYSSTDVDAEYLVFNGHRHRVRQKDLTALGLTGVQPGEVTAGLIDAIPPGPNLSVPPIEREGEGGRVIEGRDGTIGQVYVAAGQHYVLLDRGLVPIGAVMRELLLAPGAVVIPISADSANAALSANPPFEPEDFPTTMPAVGFRDAPPAMVCAVTAPVTAPTDSGIAVQVYDRVGELGPVNPAPGAEHRGPDGVELADVVQVPSGQAALVRALPAPGDVTANTTVYIVDQGFKYPLPQENAAEVMGWLGYGNVQPVSIPMFLLALLPDGLALDPLAAGRFVGVQTPSPTTPAAPPTTPANGTSG